MGALTTGLAATAVGYFVQGWFKFGGVELFKIKAVGMLGEKKAWDNRTAIYLGAAAGAEFVADCFLCPLEACRIRSVSDPTFAPTLPGVAARLIKEEGVLRGFYSGFGPTLFKQVPYTMAKFAVQGRTAESMYNSLGKSPKECGFALNTGVSLSSGVIAGVISAIISHPADTLLSKVNKALHAGPRSTLRDDWNADGIAVWHLRHGHEDAGRREVPLPQSRVSGGGQLNDHCKIMWKL